MIDHKRANQIADSLKESRKDFEPHFTELERYFMPRRGGFSDDPVGSQKSRRGKESVSRDILDGTPLRAKRILQSGLQAGVSSPARPWFRIQTVDPDLRERDAVKKFLGKAETEMRALALRSGLYNVLHVGYGDLGVYGTEAAVIEDYGQSDLRGVQLVPGTYWIGMSDAYTVDTLYREFGMTVNQIVAKFVYKGQRWAEPDWDTVPKEVKRFWDNGKISEIMTVCQVITPRRDRESDRDTGDNKPIASLYWIKEDSRPDDHKSLSMNGGYTRSPISASRWDANGYDAWGYSPAMDALPDTKELMFQRRDYAEMRRRINRPPMVGHTSLRGSAFSLMPGSMHWNDDPANALRPAFQINPNLEPFNNDMQVTKDGIWSAMYADLFMMISNLDRRQITATEIDERREEKLIALGPVLERLHFEKLRPLVERLFERVMSSGILGEPPEELRDIDLEIDFVSMLAQAQKAVATGSMERLAGYVGNLAAVQPDVLDKFDGDQSVDEYANMLGVPPGVIRSDDAVKALRDGRQSQIEAAQAAETALTSAQAVNQGAQAAKVMSEADAPRGTSPLEILTQAGLGQ